MKIGLSVIVCLGIMLCAVGGAIAQGDPQPTTSDAQPASAVEGQSPAPSSSGEPATPAGVPEPPPAPPAPSAMPDASLSGAPAPAGAAAAGAGTVVDLAKEPTAPTSSSIVERVKLGVSAWITQGETKWSHNASAFNNTPGIPETSKVGNPTSRLKYKDVGVNIVDFAPQVKFKSGWLLQGNVGYGSIGGGRVTDDDFFLLDNGQPSSRSIHDGTGDYVFYVNGDVGYSILKMLKVPERHGSLDMFIGYQYRREKHEAISTAYPICTDTGRLNTPCNLGGNVGQLVFTNTQTWHAARIGLQGEWRIFHRLSIDGKAAFLPFTSLKNEDIHHTAPQLQQNPSISMSGIGIGANLEGNINVMVIENLFLSVGYRYWWNRVSNENIDFHFVNFPTTSTKLNDFQNIRQGVTFGVNYRF